MTTKSNWWDKLLKIVIVVASAVLCALGVQAACLIMFHILYLILKLREIYQPHHYPLFRYPL